MDFLRPRRPARSPSPQPPLKRKMPQSFPNPSDMWEIFSKCDTDRSGTIDEEELKRAMRSMGYPDNEATNIEAKELFGKMDTDESGLIDFDEFYYAMKENISAKELSKDVFNRIIKSNKEKIYFKDLKETIKECGLSLSDEDIHDMIRYAPKHERNQVKEYDGIDQEEFYELLKEIRFLKDIKLSL